MYPEEICSYLVEIRIGKAILRGFAGLFFVESPTSCEAQPSKLGNKLVVVGLGCRLAANAQRRVFVHLVPWNLVTRNSA